MSELSDYRRLVSDPLEAKLRKQLANCHARIAELEALPSPPVSSVDGGCVGRLVEALKPFADASAACDEPRQSDTTPAWESSEAMSVTIGDFRRAHAALASSGSPSHRDRSEP